MLFNSSQLAPPPPPAEPKKPTRPRPVGASHQPEAKPECRLTSDVTNKQLAELLPDIAPGASIHLVAAGQWNNFDLVAHLARFVPGADLWLATWGVSDPGVRAVDAMRKRGHIREINAVVDTRTAIQRTEATAYLSQLADRFTVYPCHAKVYILRSPDRGISLVTSANLTTNPRAEAGVIADSVEVADFHIDWIRRTIAGAPPFEEQP